MSRVHELLNEVRHLQYGAAGIIDLIASWGLSTNDPATGFICDRMEAVMCAARAAAQRVNEEAARFPDEVHERRGSFLVTFTGRRFWPLDPRPEEVCVEDIAHALAHKCRWGGMCDPFYSVAEHSLNVARIAEDLARRAGYHAPYEAWVYGLLHDGEEGYLPDVPRPVKRHLHGWETIAAAVQTAIWSAFGLSVPSAEVVEFVECADNYALLLEQRQLFVPNADTWAGGLPAMEVPPHVEIMRIRGGKLGVVRRAFLRALRRVKRHADAEPAEQIITKTSRQSWRDEMATLVQPGNPKCKVCKAGGADPIIGLCAGCMG